MMLPFLCTTTEATICTVPNISYNLVYLGTSTDIDAYRLDRYSFSCAGVEPMASHMTDTHAISESPTHPRVLLLSHLIHTNCSWHYNDVI